MELAGLVLGVPGLVGLLVKTSLEGYQALSTAQALDADFGHYQHQLSVQHQILRDWVAVLKSTIGNHSKLSEFFDADERRHRLVVNTLSRIALVFADVRQLEDLYGVQSTTDSKTAASPKKPSFFRRIAQNLPHSKRSAQAPPVPAPIHVPTELYLDVDLSIDQVTPLVQRFQSTVSSYSRFKWVFSDKDKLQALIDKLKQYNNDLNNLTAVHLSTRMCRLRRIKVWADFSSRRAKAPRWTAAGPFYGSVFKE
jgi:hypothetical protein